MPTPKCATCDKKASYGFEPRRAIYCAKHGKENGAKDVMHKLCEEPNCDKRPWATRKTDYCRDHDIEGIVEQITNQLVIDVNRMYNPTEFKFCRDVECVGKQKRATYGYEKNKPVLCGPHYESHPDKANIFDAVHALCIVCFESKVYIRANFGEANKTPLYCQEHKGESQNIVMKKCIVCNEVAASFGLEGGSRTHCKKCSTEEMVSLGTTCQQCNKYASYGYPENGKLILCGQHAKTHPDADKIQFLRKNKCIKPNCNTGASFKYKDTKKPILCAAHKNQHPDKDLMVSVNTMCIVCNKVQPIFGIRGGSISHCASCKEPGMQDVAHQTCEVEDCDIRPTLGVVRGNATHCSKHGKPLGMKDTLNPICKNCNRTSVNPNYKPHCSACYFDLNKDAVPVINFKTKEFAYLNPLKELYPGLIQDRVIEGGLSRLRPDGLLCLDTHVIVVEIDEGQHTCYDDVHEDGRLQDIYNDLRGRKMKVIRLNPDGYSISGKRVKGSFVRKPDGLEKQNAEFNRRLAALKDEFARSVATVPDEEIEIVRLYYTTK